MHWQLGRDEITHTGGNAWPTSFCLRRVVLLVKYQDIAGAEVDVVERSRLGSSWVCVVLNPLLFLGGIGTKDPIFLALFDLDRRHRTATVRVEIRLDMRVADHLETFTAGKVLRVFIKPRSRSYIGTTCKYSKIPYGEFL